jgi:hypothetical protein
LSAEAGLPAATGFNPAPCDYGGGLDGGIDQDPRLWAGHVITAASPSDRNDYVVVFQHTPKTSGTSMQELIKANYPHATVDDIRHGPLDQDAMRQWWRDWLAALGPEGRADLLYLGGHDFSYALEFLDRPTKAMTMLRDPVDRAISRWYFIGDKRTDAPELEEYVFPYFLERFRELGYVTPWFNPQSRALLQAHYDLSGFEATFGPPPDADLWRERLRTTLERYVVGVQDAFEQSVDLFAHEFGWSELTIRAMKVNRYRPRAVALSRDEVDLVRAANWLDVEIHERYARGFDVEPAADESADEARRKPYVVLEGPQDPARAEELAWRRQMRAELATKIDIAQAALSRQLEKSGRRVDKRAEKTKDPEGLDDRLASLEERLSALEQLVGTAGKQAWEQPEGRRPKARRRRA